MPKPKIDLNNNAHQYILVKLCLMYYTDGDVKDVYEDEELCRVIGREFGVKDDKAMAGFLDNEEIRWYYEDWHILRVTRDELPLEEIEKA